MWRGELSFGIREIKKHQEHKKRRREGVNSAML
jgi:hypothetical protein